VGKPILGVTACGLGLVGGAGGLGLGSRHAVLAVKSSSVVGWQTTRLSTDSRLTRAFGWLVGALVIGFSFETVLLVGRGAGHRLLL
jgi:hypothetical protein